MAPESISRNKFSSKSDVYSFGILIVEELTRQKPYPDMDVQQFGNKIKENTAPPIVKYIPHDTPPPLIELVGNCTNREPESRPSFQDICSSLKSIEK